VLAVLAMTPARPVTWDALIDRVWGDQLPGDVRNVLYSYVSRLRRALGRGPDGTVLRRTGGGYRLDLVPEQVDLHRARRLAAEARAEAGAGAEAGRDRPGDRAVAARFREACDLWRGTALAGLTGGWVDRTRAVLEQERQALFLDRYEVELRLGQPAALVGPLSDLLDELPTAERAAELLMLALYRAGRQAESLALYQVVRRRLVAEIGDEPGPVLRHLHERVLRRDPGLLPEPPAALRCPITDAPPDAGPVPVPAQLPREVTGFVSRVREQRELDALLPATAEASWSVPVVVVEGPGGVGKTTLAVHWAHRTADQFPDGQLYVNLRGFDPTGTPVGPATAVRGFLDALHVPPHRIPYHLDAQVGLYRSLLAGRRMLLVLDNARDADQVRPLLPGAPGCLAVVTSRQRLSGLVATEAAHLLSLDPLPDHDARKLLADRLGAARVAAEPDAVDVLVVACAGLPLALAVVAARAAAHPTFPLATLAAQVRDAGTGLEAWTGPDPVTDVRAVFSWSYQALDPEPARTFRLLSLHPGPDVTTDAAASLAAVAPARAQRLLTTLTDAHLLTEQAPGRYQLHDLLYAYATELIETTDPDRDRHTARHRLLDHYVHTTHTAMRANDPSRKRLPLDPPRPGVVTAGPTDRAGATRWFTTERHALVAAVGYATAHGFDTHAYRLAWCTHQLLVTFGHWHDCLTVHEAALTAARRLGDPVAQARAHMGLGDGHDRLGFHAPARTHFERSLALFARAGDRSGQAYAHLRLSWIPAQQGNYPEAITHAEHARRLFHATGHRIGEARALKQLGYVRAMTGDLESALHACAQALESFQRAGDQIGMGVTWDSLGYTHHQLGDHQQAITCYQHALHIHQETGNRPCQAETLDHLGDTHHAIGDLDTARTMWQKALQILDQLGSPEADQMRTKLHTGDTSG
jgi:DNA-binding SARP family transcriptional activator/tetratricopeptide (TPR) repeat protein